MHCAVTTKTMGYNKKNCYKTNSQYTLYTYIYYDEMQCYYAN